MDHGHLIDLSLTLIRLPPGHKFLQGGKAGLIALPAGIQQSKTCFELCWFAVALRSDTGGVMECRAPQERAWWLLGRNTAWLIEDPAWGPQCNLGEAARCLGVSESPPHNGIRAFLPALLFLWTVWLVMIAFILPCEP